jgi:hypothetical protein
MHYTLPCNFVSDFIHHYSHDYRTLAGNKATRGGRNWRVDQPPLAMMYNPRTVFFFCSRTIHSLSPHVSESQFITDLHVIPLLAQSSITLILSLAILCIHHPTFTFLFPTHTYLPIILLTQRGRQLSILPLFSNDDRIRSTLYFIL